MGKGRLQQGVAGGYPPTATFPEAPMNNVAFLKLIQTEMGAESKRLTMPPEVMEKHQADAQQFEKEFDALCERHNVHAQVFAISKNVPPTFKTLFTARATSGCPVVYMGMGIQHWMLMHKFGQSVAYVMATLADFLSQAGMEKQFDKSMPAGKVERGPKPANQHNLQSQHIIPQKPQIIPATKF
jgi:hypothetical protein